MFENRAPEGDKSDIRSGVSRRGLLRGSAVLAGAGLTVAAAGRAAAGVPASGPAGPAGFVHGVASGDPLPDGVIIWTRVTPSAAAQPGSGVGETVSVTWEVATDSGFGAVVRSGTVTADPRSDHTVKVDVAGLRPGTTYFYRFTAAGQVSPVGRTRTAPATDADLDRLRFGVVSCSNWEAGYFASYRLLAERDDLDAILHLGDYIYEYGRGEYGARNGSVRLHDPAHEIVSLADYRIRHAQYKTDPDLMALHAKVPFIATWDDHESADNAYDGGAENHDPATEGDWGARKAASTQAYFEWMPVRTNGTDAALYRRFRFGALAELSMLDLRTYRDEQASSGAGWRQTDSPDRTITGRAQMDWLTGGIVTSPTRWKLVGNPVMIAPCAFPPLDTRTTAAVTEMIGLPDAGIPFNTDQWDGYTADRRRLFDAITANNVRNTVFLTGDIHTSWACDLPVDAANYPAAGTVGTEFVVPSVTSPNIDDSLQVPPRTATVPVEEAFKAFNRHVRYVELDSHGYGVFEVNKAGAQMDWFYVNDPTDPRGTARHGVSYRVADGSQQAHPVGTPLDPAAYRP
ncbi:alkaline phosphatase D family protein [Rhodococcus sp. AG1013]|uniref:alkaline phosphatase D family protein n=1 Tax=unclassified Rhodococcus (in: high G+C Gram-positive bacteria) TaxID=192944 RepID=UPI000E0B5A3E|nr:alkaline phosphatase D family protein [Rhodococcus sp. AG1013]RDI12383.1 alkaline phosphatase D [Rhodococcus sp. AG1013]